MLLLLDGEAKESDADGVATGIETDSEFVRKGVTTGMESVATPMVEDTSATETCIGVLVDIDSAMGEPVTLKMVPVEVIVMLKTAVAMGLGARVSVWERCTASRGLFFGFGLT